MHHFDVLCKDVEGTMNREREPVSGEFQRDATKYLFEVPLERINPGWTLRLGEFLYNTRSSLDYLITALIRSTGKEEHEASQFPIYAPNGIGWDNINQWW